MPAVQAEYDHCELFMFIVKNIRFIPEKPCFVLIKFALNL